jgi:hypothetical protein
MRDWPDAWTVMIERGLYYNVLLMSVHDGKPYPDGFWGQRLPSEEANGIGEGR